ncbi:PREDICTED: 28S ribosomal protein S15, mitochondrial [Rhagoletis zephyria]|uniref:28S ribosomal protein S15, mitochondrial n=1 Tax=Rhagoletis zephyria TaxID=28612 RepID=UPI0008117A31|nr:PREDICTED: 28S ribosomal protein S15, mitochondrial [Rhagoletis zephyria]
MNFAKILRACKGMQWQLSREYAFKSDLKIKWVRPEKIPCTKPEKSGDLGKLPPVNEKEFLLDYKDSRELQSADPIVQSLFQLGNNRCADTARYLREQLIKEVQRHPLDYGSMEAKLARMTVRIRIMQDELEQYPRNTKLKVALKELIDKRKKFLKYLRRWDYRRFEWMLEKLDLVYKPPPAEFHWITRKESLQKLTDAHCEKIKEERLAEYRNMLDEQKIPFLEEAIKKMEFVRKEQIDLEIPVSVTEEQIKDFKRELEALKSKREVKLDSKK